MNRLYSRAGAFALSSALCLITVGRLSAQTTAAPGAAPSADEEAIVLSPFVVEASEDADNYAAKNTLAGTRVRTELRDVGSAIQAITAKFLQDTGAKNSQDLLVYTTSTEVGGSSGNFVGSGGGASIDTRNARVNPQTNTRVRGLSAADNTRDFFLTDIPWDSYNVDRIDLQRGPNSILFGIGSPAGIVNASMNGAAFKNANKVEFRFDNNGSKRGSADFNRVLLKNELAFRLSFLDDNTEYKQKPAYNHDKRVYAAVRYDPAFLKKNGMSTSIKANFESGRVDANRPRVIPPIDAISPWFDPANASLYKKTFNNQHIAINDPTDPLFVNDPTAGANQKTLNDNSTPNPRWVPYMGAYGGQIFDQPTAIFADPTSGNMSGFFAPSLSTKAPGVQGATNYEHPSGFNGGPWLVYKGISGYYDYAQQAQLPNYLLGVYKNKTLADRGIFDYENNLIDGPNKKEMQKFHAFDATVSQTFLDNAVGVEVAYNRQVYAEEDGNTLGTPYLTVEVANTLPDGRANPNVGRAMTIGSPYTNQERETVRDALRATAYGELDFKKVMGSNSTLGKLLGVHRATGLYAEQQEDTDRSSWYAYGTAPGYVQWNNPTLDGMRIPTVHYLSGDLRSAGSASGLNISRITGVQAPYTDRLFYFDPRNQNGAKRPDGSTEAVIPFGTEMSLADLKGWNWTPYQVRNGFNGTDRKALTKGDNVSGFREKISSQAFILQSFWWDDAFVTTVGWRKDTDKNYRKPKMTSNADTSANWSDPNYHLPAVPTNEETGESKSWSMVLHTPKSMRKSMPGGLDVSLFYNRSSNFQPAGGRVDIFGGSLASPTGKTKDYGFTITAFDDKVSLKVNWYETSVKDQSLDGGGIGNIQNVYRIGSNEAWGYRFAKSAQAGLNDFRSNNYALVTPNDPTSARIDPAIGDLRYQPAPGQTIAAALAAQNAALNSFLDPANKPPAAFLSAFSIARDAYDVTINNNLGWSEPPGLAITGDTASEGIEYELTAQPIPGWNIQINAAKTDATRLNLAGSFAAYVDARNTFYQGPAGDVRLWNGGYGGQTIKSVWNADFYNSYLLYKLQEGASVPELRPWRFNVITNYDFRKGALKGFNVGGGYRWQDGNVIGYPIKNNFFDLENPYVGPKETSVDIWVGYERKITSKITWRIQLNARNVLGNHDLIPVTVQPDGSPGTSRIPEPKVFSLTNTFKF